MHVVISQAVEQRPRLVWLVSMLRVSRGRDQSVWHLASPGRLCGKIGSHAHSGCWQGSVPRGWRAKVPVSLQAGGWCHSQLLEAVLPPWCRTHFPGFNAAMALLVFLCSDPLRPPVAFSALGRISGGLLHLSLLAVGVHVIPLGLPGKCPLYMSADC